MTLLTAVSTAEGVTDRARRKDVVVFRSVGGQDYAALYNLKAIEQGNYPDPEIYASDIVMVGEDAARGVWVDYVSPLLGPIIFLIGREISN
jgi:polysaccharide biosynthesis/export protein